MNAAAVALAAVEAIARARHGVFSVDDATISGVSAGQLRHHTKPGGRWRRIVLGVYGLSDVTPDPQQPLFVAALWARHTGILSHRSAATLRGWDGLPSSPPVELTVWDGGASPDPTWHLYRTRRTLEDEEYFPDGGGLTGPLRTLADLGAVLDDEHWERAMESAVRADRSILADIERWSCVPRRGVTGVVLVREVLARRPQGAPATESELETRFVQLARRSMVMPEPVRQWEVRHRDALIARLDLSWPDIRLYVELDGVAFHSTTIAQRSDASRQHALAERGWIPLRFGWDDVVKRPASTLRRTEATWRAWNVGGDAAAR